MTDLCDLSAVDLLQLYRTREASPVDVIHAVLERAALVQPSLNAFCRIDGDAALAGARSAEAAWVSGDATRPLEGVPVSIKDVVTVEGWLLGRGSKMSDFHPPASADAPSVARLRAAGAVLFASTTTCEGGWKAVTDSPRTGITRNPHDPALTPGGSSGGAVVAVATGAGPLALGSDGGGSVRIPASFTGLFGIKPSYGRVPQYPLGAHYLDLSHIGPLARDVEDAGLMLQVMAGQHPLDADTLADFPAPLVPVGSLSLKGLRVGVTEDFGFLDVSPEVLAVFRAVVDRMRHAGADVIEVPRFDDWRPTYRTLWEAGAWQAQRKLDPKMRGLVDPGLQAAGDAGAKVTKDDYLDAVMRRHAYGIEASRLHERMDFVLSPTVAVLPFAAGRDVPDASTSHWLDWAAISQLANLTGQPASSVPAGYTQAGLPVGIQVTGRMHDDVGVLRCSKALEALLPDGKKAPSQLVAGLRGTAA